MQSRFRKAEPFDYDKPFDYQPPVRRPNPVASKRFTEMIEARQRLWRADAGVYSHNRIDAMRDSLRELESNEAF